MRSVLPPHAKHPSPHPWGLAVACLAHTSGPAFDQALLKGSFAVRKRSAATSRRTHVVKHVWYHAWPDHGVPRTPNLVPDPSHILDMLQVVEAHRADGIARRDMEVCNSLLSVPLCLSFSPMDPRFHSFLPHHTGCSRACTVVEDRGACGGALQCGRGPIGVHRSHGL